ncbi:MAG: hypothetical protein AAGH89_06260, partial [Verrucomicrobiota bacterium]
IKSLTIATLGLANIVPLTSLAGDLPEIRKVKYERLNLSESLRTEDAMVSFERKYLLHGAITSEEYRAREGKYYTIFWKSKGDRRPGMVVRLEYLQSNTGDEIKVKEVTVDDVRRQNTTDINVIGEEFKEDGNVVAWRASLVRDGEVISSVESFLWE